MLNSKSFVSPVPETSRFSVPGYYVWGSSIVKGQDGLFHMIFSLWEEEYGYDAWMQHSKLGYATSESATGPYNYHGIIAEGSGDDNWDAVNIHNECLLYEDGMFYLYYTGAKGNGEFWDNRNHQRVGVMTAEKPSGPWKRYDHPLIDVKGGCLITATPNVIKMADGNFLMVYKTVLPGPLPFGGKVVHKAAVAKHPLGPFVDRETPFLDLPDVKFPIDDHTQWYENGVYYAIVKDNQNAILKQGVGSLLYKSKDALKWELTDDPFLLGLQLKWESGLEELYSRLEMPKVVWDNGKIVAIAFAARPIDESKLSFNVQIPIR